LTVAEWEALFEAQGRKCASCGASESGGSKCAQWHTDHDHATGKVRGILCARCNTMTGLVESPTFGKVLAYLRLADVGRF
jgi:hypothetical protein